MESTAPQNEEHEPHDAELSYVPPAEDLPPQEHPDDITPEYVCGLLQPADRFLCKLSDNWPQFKFQGFSIRDVDSKMVLVTVPPQPDLQLSDDDDMDTRVVKYHLGPMFLKLRNVGLTL